MQLRRLTKIRFGMNSGSRSRSVPLPECADCVEKVRDEARWDALVERGSLTSRIANPDSGKSRDAKCDFTVGARFEVCPTFSTQSPLPDIPGRFSERLVRCSSPPCSPRCTTPSRWHAASASCIQCDYRRLNNLFAYNCSQVRASGQLLAAADHEALAGAMRPSLAVNPTAMRERSLGSIQHFRHCCAEMGFPVIFGPQRERPPRDADRQNGEPNRSPNDVIGGWASSSITTSRSVGRSDRERRREMGRGNPAAARPGYLRRRKPGRSRRDRLA